MNTPWAQQILYRSLERSLNAALALDPSAQAQLRTLEGKVVALVFTQPELHFFIEFRAESVACLTHSEAPAHCTLTGKLADFAALARQTERHTLANSGVQVTGDPGLLTQLQNLARNLEIDWEQPLVDTFGDVAGHGMAHALRAQYNFVNNATRNAPEHIGQWLSEELGLLIAPLELEQFTQHVDQLRADGDRLAARIEKLQASLRRKRETST